MRCQTRSPMDSDARRSAVARRSRSLVAGLVSPEVCLVTVVLMVFGGIAFSGSEAAQDSDGILGQHRSPVEGVAFAPDGRTVASASRDGTLRVWDRGDPGMGQVVATAGSGFSSVAFSPDGRALVAGQYDGGVALCDPATGAPLLAIAKHDAAVRAVAFAPDGQSVVSAADDGSIRVRDARTGRPRLELQAPAPLIQGIAFTPDGRSVVSVSIAGAVVVWDVATGRIRDQFHVGPGHLASVAVSPDGRALALVGGERITLRTLATGRSRSWTCAVRKVTAARFLRGGSALAVSGLDGSIVVWDVSAAEPARRAVLRGHKAGVKALAVSPDGATLLSGGNDDTIRSWEIAGLLVE